MDAPDTSDHAAATTAAVPRTIEVGFPLSRSIGLVVKGRTGRGRTYEVKQMGGFVQVIFEWQLSFGDEL